jgi:hypothetical protein
MKIFNIFIFLLAFSFAGSAYDLQLIDAAREQWSTQQAQQLAAVLTQAEKEGLTIRPLENKAYEGLAKKAPASQVLAAINVRLMHLREIRKPDGPVSQNGQIIALYQKERQLASRQQAIADSVMQKKKQQAENTAVAPKAASASTKTKGTATGMLKKHPQDNSVKAAKDNKANSESDNKIENAVDKAERKAAKEEARMERLEKKSGGNHNH